MTDLHSPCRVTHYKILQFTEEETHYCINGVVYQENNIDWLSLWHRNHRERECIMSLLCRGDMNSTQLNSLSQWVNSTQWVQVGDSFPFLSQQRRSTRWYKSYGEYQHSFSCFVWYEKHLFIVVSVSFTWSYQPLIRLVWSIHSIDSLSRIYYRYRRYQSISASFYRIITSFALCL